MKLTGVGLPLAEALFKGGYASLVDISETSVEDIVSIVDLSETQVEEMIEEAKVILKEELRQEEQDQNLEDDEEAQESEDS